MLSIFFVVSFLLAQQHRYIACYKPALTLCSLAVDADRAKRKHRAERPTLAGLSLPVPSVENNANSNDEDDEQQQQQQQLHVVGRLDRDSEGLLLLTTDGRFTARVLSSPDCHKRYWALVQGTPNDASLEKMRAGGLEIRGARTRPPISVRRLSREDLQQQQPQRLLLPKPALGMDRVGTWLEVVLNEGRHRQVRKITATAGHKTIRLCRVAIGALELQDIRLQPGEWKYIAKDRVLHDTSPSS